MRILGCVKEVNELELVISLPNGLQGFVQVTEICDAYTKKLNEQVAQEEPLKVRRVWVKPARNRGYQTDVKDHFTKC
jgi:ribosomal protein S1